MFSVGPLEWALHYAAMGYPVLPVAHRSKVPVVDPALGLRRGKDDATLDPTLIRTWWSAHPEAGVAVLPPKEVLVLDLDSTLGLTTLMLLAPEFRQAPKARSGGGGAHVWFRLPPGSPPLSASARVLPSVAADLRGMGRAYLVAPPSLHPTGRPYEWIVPLRPPSDLPLFPQALMGLLRKAAVRREPIVSAREVPRPSPFPSRRERAYALAELRARCEQMARTPEGQRHLELVRHAVALWAWVRQGALKREEIESALFEAALRSGLEEREIAGVLRWVQGISPVRTLKP
uniref:Bifunctional DNA primase/polymerase n=1 Tax=Thermus caliditerrae TaxID=1330700 RepID=A0A7C5RF72_9DEIN